jgi:UDP-N-acetylglucosamine 4,6-dehydratase
MIGKFNYSSDMSILDGSSILITGGTGSFGQNIVKHLLETSVSRIAIFSRDELKQSDLRGNLGNDERLRFFLGDIRDEQRLITAFHGVDYVVHAAALKQVDTGEYNPFEFVQTNVLGSQNVISAAMKTGIKKVVALSTDKASSPINLYGATKLTADKLFIAANNYSQAYGTKFSVVRYGNVLGSRGSVIPFFAGLKLQGKDIPITDKRMTRFWISIKDAINFVIDSFEQMSGGELYVPKIPSMKIFDLAKLFAEESRIIEVGVRPGEKLHEEMISPDDSRRTLDLGTRYVVNPLFAEWGYIAPKGKAVTDGFSYRSDSNTEWISSSKMREIVEKVIASEIR